VLKDPTCGSKGARGIAKLLKELVPYIAIKDDTDEMIDRALSTETMVVLPRRKKENMMHL
jgi:hypothetical protein